MRNLTASQRLNLCTKQTSVLNHNSQRLWPVRNGMMHRAIVQAALVLSTQQNKCIFRKVKERGNSDENLPCTCHRRSTPAFSCARWCRYPLSCAALSCIRGHRLHPDCGAMRDGGALLSPQVIREGFKAVVILLRSLLLTGDQSRKLKVGDRVCW